jgi:hypothetical protein
MAATPEALTFDMSGGWRQAKLAGGRPLDGNAKGLPTFVARRPGAKIGGVQSHQSEALKGEVREADYTMRGAR